ncbi:hypothetical protein, partial [Xanthomonas perforans]|uniref:hypothetical protein n=1 Tax=Xanthomonas perforans TaxID=442694 RepID=UPI00235885EC
MSTAPGRRQARPAGVAGAGDPRHHQQLHQRPHRGLQLASDVDGDRALHQVDARRALQAPPAPGDPHHHQQRHQRPRRGLQLASDVDGDRALHQVDARGGLEGRPA